MLRWKGAPADERHGISHFPVRLRPSIPAESVMAILQEAFPCSTRFSRISRPAPDVELPNSSTARGQAQSVRACTYPEETHSSLPKEDQELRRQRNQTAGWLCQQDSEPGCRWQCAANIAPASAARVQMPS